MNHVNYPGQEWYWTEEWQFGEREVTAQIASGDTRMFGTTEEFLAFVEDPTRVPVAGTQRGFIRRHKVMISIMLVCVLGVISGAIPPLARILNVVFLVAVIVAAVAVVGLFTYLVGTSVRAALRARWGKQW